MSLQSNIFLNSYEFVREDGVNFFNVCAWRMTTLRHTILRVYFNTSSTKINTKASFIYAIQLPQQYKWYVSLRFVSACLRSLSKSVKNSLSSIPAIMKNRYYENMVNLKPKRQCDLDNVTKVCKHCYYFKRLNQFVEFAINQE
ncbi:hypothetical protein IGI04_019127 [Brassica rapa subsp. trilocularis]|uniref:Uncharacterized protein n=1 Tax=Brassica rapa subsp. trilocularis TaxID=1813537 RepID=A0ABQ7MEY3_BRACM|nr:hypothetical protein IGI04_019127 [Brassica rapa subsp. trilocularis]